MHRMKNRILPFFGFLIAFVVIFLIVYPGIRIETERKYFDIYSGRIKTQYIFCGWFYYETIKHTNYSLMLIKHHLTDLNENWKLAGYKITASPWNITRVGNLWFNCLRIAVEILEMHNFDHQKERRHLDYIRSMVMELDTDGISDFVSILLDDLPESVVSNK